MTAQTIPIFFIIVALCFTGLGCSQNSSSNRPQDSTKTMNTSNDSKQFGEIDLCNEVANELSMDETVVRRVLNSAIGKIAKQTETPKELIGTEFGYLHIDGGMRKVRNPDTGEIAGILNLQFTANEETARQFPDYKRTKPKPAKKSFPEFRIKIYKSDENLDDDRFAENQIGVRSKLGGSPNFLHGDQNSICQKCNREMTFIGQIDSFGLDPTLLAPESEKQRWILEDAGLAYFFFCFECGNGDCILEAH